MGRLDLNDLRRSAQNAHEALVAEAAYMRDLIDGLHRMIFECSPDGIVALVTMAHMSLIADGFPTEVALGGKSSPLKGEDVICRMEADGVWTGRASRPMADKGIRPEALVETVAVAAHIPYSAESRASILAVINPLHDRDFEHFARVLDIIPLHTLSAMMANGPVLARTFSLFPQDIDADGFVSGHNDNGLLQPNIRYHDDIDRFARCIGEAIERRGASLAGLDVDLRSAAVSFMEKAGEDRSMVPDRVFHALPTCIHMFDPHVPVEAIEVFLMEAVRVGFDINAISHNSFSYPKTAADCAVNLIDVKALVRLEELGLDIARADGAHSLTSVALSRIRRSGDRKAAFAVLKHLVNRRGLAVHATSYSEFAESVTECKRNIHSGYADNKLLVAKYEFLTKVMDFIDERFPDLRKPQKSRRKAA